jgi:8-oxo-dGTP diphosphatase
VAQFKSIVLSRLWKLIPDTVQWWTIWLLRPKLFVGVSGILFNEAGEVLLLRHRFHHRHPWGLPGGLLERGENLVECWQREVREETNLIVAVERLITQRTTQLNIDFILQGRITGGEILLDSTEILEAAFFPPDALPDELHREHRAAIRKALEGQSLLAL